MRGCNDPIRTSRGLALKNLIIDYDKAFAQVQNAVEESFCLGSFRPLEDSSILNSLANKITNKM